MLKEALELIQHTARKAAEITILDPSADGRIERFEINGQIVEKPIPPPNRLHSVHSLVHLINYVKTAEDPVVWYASSRVELVLDDDDQRDRVVFELTPTPQLQALERLADPAVRPEPFSQRGLLNFLRLDLDVPAETVALFRKLDWTESKKAASEVRPNRESLGREVLAEVHAIEGLPEELAVEIPVYRQFGERAPQRVRLAIEIDVPSQRFYVSPVPGELDTAVQQAQMSIGERLSAALKDIPIYYGAP